MRKLALGTLLLGLAGCGSGEWMDVAIMDCRDLERADAAVTLADPIGPALCGQADNLVYGHEFRCKDDKVQVFCRKP